MYVHDDSETQCDEFVLAASATRPGQESVVRDLDTEDWSTEIKVTISIWLKNDEKPVHMVVYSESHHHTQILHSKTLVVEEGKPVKLSRGRLQMPWRRKTGSFHDSNTSNFQ
ncbi:Chondroitin sulfate proteoglycan 4 [Manis javanica]|nr:Chondroitin sulfate proteoglycan 4 [Manis javanica]